MLIGRELFEKSARAFSGCNEVERDDSNSPETRTLRELNSSTGIAPISSAARAAGPRVGGFVLGGFRTLATALFGSHLEQLGLNQPVNSRVLKDAWRLDQLLNLSQ